MNAENSPRSRSPGVGGPVAAAMAAFLLITVVSNRQNEEQSSAPEEQLQKVYSATYIEDNECLEGTTYDREGAYDQRTGDFVVGASDVGEHALRFVVVGSGDPEVFALDPDADSAAILASHGC